MLWFTLRNIALKVNDRTISHSHSLYIYIWAIIFSFNLFLIHSLSLLLSIYIFLIFLYQFCLGGLSYDDIDLFSRLRSITIVKGVVWPTKLAAYMEYFSVKGDVPLYDSMAC